MTNPPPIDRAYVGDRKPLTAGPGTVWRVERNGARTLLPPCFEMVNHSPSGLSWGYNGSGPSQLSFALVYDATGDERLARKVYQRFKFEIVSGLPDRWQLEAENIAAFARSLEHVPEEQL